jgi:hypothetical protein
MARAWGSVIPAKAGTPGREVSAGLPEVPALAGMTGERGGRKGGVLQTGAAEAICALALGV